MAMSSMALGGGILWKIFPNTEQQVLYISKHRTNPNIFPRTVKTILFLEHRIILLHYTSMGPGRNAGRHLLNTRLISCSDALH